MAEASSTRRATRRQRTSRAHLSARGFNVRARFRAEWTIKAFLAVLSGNKADKECRRLRTKKCHQTSEEKNPITITLWLLVCISHDPKQRRSASQRTIFNVCWVKHSNLRINLRRQEAEAAVVWIDIVPAGSSWSEDEEHDVLTSLLVRTAARLLS